MNKSDEIQKLLAISLFDGRNRDKMEKVAAYFSEFALIKYRIRIEVAYILFLSREKIIRKINLAETDILNSLWQKFTPESAIAVKEIEVKINHDVKAVEYYLQSKLDKTTLTDLIPFIHFGLTSYDINIPAYGLMLKEFRQDVLMKVINKLVASLKELIIKTTDMPMLGRTHGQPALPTTM